MVFAYSSSERMLMAIITGASNIATIPGLFLMKKQGRNFTYYLSIFALTNSVLYHICESLDIILFIPQKKWHELDNIGAICCMNSLIISLTKYSENKAEQNKLNYISLFLALIFQKKDPWDLSNTIIPIAIISMMTLYQMFKLGLPKYYFNPLSQGLVLLVLALAMFIKGLDDLNDYLRIYHSLWHVLIGLSTYYLWQIQKHTIFPMSRMISDIIQLQFE